MCAANKRDLRARRGHYSLRDLAGLAEVERLLAAHTIGEWHFSDVVDDGAPADDATASAPPRPQSGARLPSRR